jgi:hypothetical protein
VKREKIDVGIRRASRGADPGPRGQDCPDAQARPNT